MFRYCLILFGLIVSLSASRAQSRAEIDSLLDQLKYAKRDTNKLKLLIRISNKYFGIPDYVSALPICEQSLELANELKVSHGIALASENLASCQRYIGDYTDAIHNYLNAVKYWEGKGENRKIAQLYSCIASIHKSDYNKALKYYKEALKYIELSGDKSEIAYTLWSMNASYIEACKKALSEKDSINANKFYFEIISLLEKSLDLVKTENDTNNIVKYLNSLGVFYDKCNLCDNNKIIEQSKIIRFDFSGKSIALQEEALRLSKLTKDKLGMISTWYYIGDFYLHQGMLNENKGNYIKANTNYKNALTNYLLALEGVKQDSLEHGIANYSKAIGEAYMRLGNFKKSEKYLLESERIFKKRKFRTGILECYLLLSTLYERASDNKNALAYYKKYSELSDSLSNEESLKDRNLLISQFDLNKTNQKLTLARAENEIKESNIKQQRLVIAGIGIGAILSIFILFLLIGVIRGRQKRKLSELNQTLLQTQREALNAQMSDHFISNTMNSINNFIEKNNKEKASEYLLLFNRVIRRVMQNSFQKVVPLENDLEVLKGYFDLERLRFKENSLNIEVKIGDDVDPQSTLIPPMIFQTLVENSIKHGFKKSEGGTIKVLVRKNLDKLECTVEDNGMGRTASMQERAIEDISKQSYGSGLAERLATIAGGSYSVTDLFDTQGNPSGTRTNFSFSIVSL